MQASEAVVTDESLKLTMIVIVCYLYITTAQTGGYDD